MLFLAPWFFGRKTSSLNPEMKNNNNVVWKEMKEMFQRKRFLFKTDVNNVKFLFLNFVSELLWSLLNRTLKCTNLFFFQLFDRVFLKLPDVKDGYFLFFSIVDFIFFVSFKVFILFPFFFCEMSGFDILFQFSSLNTTNAISLSHSALKH